jgi:aminoglycoside phosphotransferase (APT) family kinase protein
MTDSSLPAEKERGTLCSAPFSFKLVTDYLSDSLRTNVRIRSISELPASTRSAPLLIDCSISGLGRRFVFRYGGSVMKHEYNVLRALMNHPLPSPGAYGWEEAEKYFGQRGFIYEFIDGDSLLPPMLRGEEWAFDLYIETALQLDSVKRHCFSTTYPDLSDGESAEDILIDAYQYLSRQRDKLHTGSDNDLLNIDRVYQILAAAKPSLPALRFSNGDLYPDNIRIRDKKLTGIIDFAFAGFSDPLYEFLLPFFLHPELRGRGVEARYCRIVGIDPAALQWYHRLEYFDSLRWILKSGQNYGYHTAESIISELSRY